VFDKKMKIVPDSLFIPLVLSTLFTGLFLASWIAYFWGDGDGERAAFCTLVMLFAGPLLVGSKLVLRGKRLGFLLLRFGSILFIFEPLTLFSLWGLENDPEYISYLSQREKKHED